MTPEQARLVEKAKSVAAGIEALRGQMADLATERRELIRQVVDELGFEGALEALGMKRQTLAGLLPASSRRPAEPPLFVLVQAGVLEPGEPLVINRRKGRTLEAWVEADGSIRVGRDDDAQVFPTPSKAAGVLMNVKSVDGWLRFRLPNRGWQTLHELRRQVTGSG
jgi:hypothetical protein